MELEKENALKQTGSNNHKKDERSTEKEVVRVTGRCR